MSGLTKTNVQIGDSSTATQNFVLSVPASPDGTIKLARGNFGATTQDVLTVASTGVVTATQGFTVGTLNILFGAGVPSVSATQGSLYLRTDGSSTSTRMYVNTNGSTGWTNLVTAA